MSEITLPRMRTIHQIYEYLHDKDPDSKIGEDYLRKLVKQGKIPSYKAGVRHLVNLDRVIEYFNTPHPEDEPQENYGRIRKIY